MYIHISSVQKVISLGCVRRQKFKSSHWHDSDLPHTWKQKHVLSSGVTAHQQSSVWARAGKSMFCSHRVVNDWSALCSSPKAPLLTYFFPSDKLVRSDKGEAVMAQREAREPRRDFILGGTRFDTGVLQPRTQHDGMEMQDQTERCGLRVLISLQSKLLLWCVEVCGNPNVHWWFYSWATAQLSQEAWI